MPTASPLFDITEAALSIGGSAVLDLEAGRSAAGVFLRLPGPTP